MSEPTARALLAALRAQGGGLVPDGDAWINGRDLATAPRLPDDDLLASLGLGETEPRESPSLATAARAVLTARDRLADEGDTLEVRLALGDAMAGLRAVLAPGDVQTNQQ